ncbi:hypothetical protein C2845_PM12G10770 [Panicum miliaceum]|uniref:Uncharacterized protein n=1 Tax=Panicum miliaceum TaxID=4540 RepID=A0A3L6QD89_PANMI|nr:hypothetical protein C2845_PM12G10770 [Panicum miliaceum]
MSTTSPPPAASCSHWRRASFCHLSRPLQRRRRRSPPPEPARRRVPAERHAAAGQGRPLVRRVLQGRAGLRDVRVVAAGHGEHQGRVMTLNDFEEGGDGGDPSECDGRFHRNSERVVALSTGWYAKGRRCGKNIRISARGRSVLAKVVDECDSLNGCDKPHAYQPPCRPNIVDASQAVWDALGITGDDVGEYPITWSDA